MLVIGARGFAKEVLEILYQLNDIENVVFYDDITINIPKLLYDKFQIIKTLEDASTYLQHEDHRFTLGLGSPILRRQFYDTFTTLGGTFTSTLSPKASIGHYGVSLGIGSNIFDHAIISNGVKTGIGTIVYFNSVIAHDVSLGNFVEISPSANLLGRCVIGDYTQIGSQATILPDIVIGKNVIVAAGAVVTKDVPNNCMVAGVPALVKKQIDPLKF